MSIDPTNLLPTKNPEVHVVLTYVIIALFAILTIVFNVEWLIFKNTAAQTQALVFDGVVLAALNVQAVSVTKRPNA